MYHIPSKHQKEFQENSHSSHMTDAQYQHASHETAYLDPSTMPRNSWKARNCTQVSEKGIVVPSLSSWHAPVLP